MERCTRKIEDRENFAYGREDRWRNGKYVKASDIAFFIFRG